MPFIEVNRLIGSRCRTGHTARALMRKGLLKGTRLNSRVIRYSENSVLALIAGRATEAQPEPTSELDRAIAQLCAELAQEARQPETPPTSP